MLSYSLMFNEEHQLQGDVAERLYQCGLGKLYSFTKSSLNKEEEKGQIKKKTF